MKTIYYLTILNNKGHVVSYQTEDYDVYSEYLECTIGHQVNICHWGGNKHDLTGVICDTSHPKARYQWGQLLDMTKLECPNDTYGITVIEPLNQ